MGNKDNVKEILEEIRKTELDFEILNKNLDDKRQTHFWYGGPVLKFFYKDYEIIIEAVGEVDFTLERYSDGGGFRIVDKDDAGYLGKILINYFQTDDQLHALLETGIGYPNYDAYYKQINHWQYRIKNEKYPEDTIADTSSFTLINVIEDLQEKEVIERLIEFVENKTRCHRCKSEDLNIYSFSPNDKPYLIRREYSCKRCKNFWYEDSI